MGVRRRIRERGISIGLMAFVSVFALACASLWTFRSLSGWVDHTHRMISAINEVELLTERSEAVARGFLLTGNPRMLDYGRRTRSEVTRLYADLIARVADNPDQQEKLRRAQTVFERRETELNLALDRPHEPQRLFDISTVKSLRRANQDFEDEELRLLAQRSDYADWLMIAAALFMTLGFMLAVFFTRTGQAWIQLKSTESSLAREQALELARIKSDFLTTMSHEIRTPVTGVMGVCDLLLDSALAAEQATYVRTIRSSADSILTLMNQVLEHGRVESGSIELEKIDFDPRAAFGSVLDLFRARAVQKGVALRLEIDDSVPTTVRGDAVRLRQVLANLVSNALKFTDRGHVQVTVEQNDDELHVEVEDTGRGIPAGARLFEKYAQVRPSGEGSGLGLMICKGFVEAMRGEIGFESREGSGSCFWFCARVERADAMEAGPLRGHVLIAEDHPINQTVIRKYVESFGLSATVVRDGKAAVEAVSGGAFDLVLMDCQMPEMDGFAATYLIRRLPNYSCLPVLALTATDTPADRARALDVGMNDFLVKPIDPARLRTAIARHLRASTEFDAEMLSRLRGLTSGERSLIEVLREELADDGARSLGKMIAAARDSNLAALSALAHGLKSSGRALGLAHFGRLCEEIERAPTSETAPLEALREAFERGQEWLRGVEV